LCFSTFKASLEVVTKDEYVGGTPETKAKGCQLNFAQLAKCMIGKMVGMNQPKLTSSSSFNSFPYNNVL